MATVAVLGAGIAGHTAAMVLRRNLPRDHRVVVVSPKSDYNWIPSNIWVGVGRVEKKEVLIPLAPVYQAHGIEFVQAKAESLHPEGDAERGPFVRARSTVPEKDGEVVDVAYDYLINATGPRLRFDMTEGLGPDGGHTHSVCTADHATHAAAALQQVIAKLQAGTPQTLVIGTGHGLCTCQGAAFEYVFNVDHELRRAGVRDRATVYYLTNEFQLGDFGVDGMVLKRGGYRMPSWMFANSLYNERNIRSITGAHVQKVAPGEVHYELLDGTEHVLKFDFSMLIPPFSGVGLKAFDKAGADISDKLFAPSGFMKVDADYTVRTYEEWKASDWPKTYQSPAYRNLFAVGIAFAPPHAISRPRSSPKGTKMAPAPPRTGMPSASMARAVAESVVDMVLGRSSGPTREASMADMGAACVASAGHGHFDGSAVAMTMYPIVPDYERFPLGGRDANLTFGEVGAAGHWIKVILHHMFIYKAKGGFGWWLVPE